MPPWMVMEMMTMNTTQEGENSGLDLTLDSQKTGRAVKDNSCWGESGHHFQGGNQGPHQGTHTCHQEDHGQDTWDGNQVGESPLPCHRCPMIQDGEEGNQDQEWGWGSSDPC